MGSVAYHSVPMEGLSQVGVTTLPSVSGTRQRATIDAPSPGIRIGLEAFHSVPMEALSQVGVDDGTVLLWELIPSADVNATVSVSPASVPSPAIGEPLTLSINIAGGEKVAGYQATVEFDSSALRYVESANGDFLPAGAFVVTPVVSGNRVTLAATSLAGESRGDGTLATVSFEVVAVKASSMSLADVVLSDSAGAGLRPEVENGQVVEPPQVTGDVNQDGVVNILDLVLVAGQLGQTGQNDADVNGDGISEHPRFGARCRCTRSGGSCACLAPRDLCATDRHRCRALAHRGTELRFDRCTVKKGDSFPRTTPYSVDSERDSIAAELPQPVQSGDVDTVSPRLSRRCPSHHL